MKNKPLIIGLAIFLLLILLALLFRSNRKPLDWRETYEESSKSPYGTFIIYELLQTYFPGEDFEMLSDSIRGKLPVAPADPANYVFIGEAMYMDSADVQTLLDFVAGGQKAFISSRTIPYDLMFYLYYDECNDFYWDDYTSLPDSTARLNLNHESLRTDTGFVYKYIQKFRPKPYRWQYMEAYFFCEEDNSLTELGRMNEDFINFAKVKYGEGTFYLHTTPIAFSNISMVEKQSLEYANRIFSHLDEGTIYWDGYSRISEMVGRRRNEAGGNTGERRLSNQSPLQYILDQPPLAWAWYLLLGAGLLYLFFRTKRRQRIIPVLEKNTNTSLEFLSTIGRLYFLQNNHRQLCLQKMKLFQSYIRERYHIQSRELDEEFLQKLSSVSEVPNETIEKILLMNKNIENSKFVSENTLIDFHLVMDQFYKKCK